MSLIVNHVMSSSISSGIFSDLINYYKMFCDNNIKIIESVKPIDTADVYHYHRPHLENRLKDSSVVTVHHDLSDTDKWLEYSKFHERYEEAKVVFCLNNIQQQFLNSQGIMHTQVIPHGYNKKIFQPIDTPKLYNDKLTIGVVSKRYGRKVKGEAYLLELFKRLDSNKFKFIFVGVDRSISALKAEKYGFEVECYEYLPYLCFGDLYKKINFLLMTSLYEGGPANIPEAIASGTPLLSMKIGMSNDYITHGVNGIFLSGDVDVDVGEIHKYSSDINYKKLAIGAFESQRDVLSWEEVMALSSKAYKKIAGGV